MWICYFLTIYDKAFAYNSPTAPAYSDVRLVFIADRVTRVFKNIQIPTSSNGYLTIPLTFGAKVCLQQHFKILVTNRELIKRRSRNVAHKNSFLKLSIIIKWQWIKIANVKIEPRVGEFIYLKVETRWNVSTVSLNIWQTSLNDRLLSN